MTNTSQSSQADLQTQVLIIGGGPVGGLLACCLAQVGIATLVVEAQDPARLAEPGTDGRSIAIALSAQRVFAGAGVWAGMADEAQPILKIRVTDQDSPVFLDYDHDSLGDDPFGWIVENTTIRRAVHGRLNGLAKARVLAPARVIGLTRDDAGVAAFLDDGRRIIAQLAIGADGRASPTRVGAGIGLTKWDYHQSGIVCTVAHEKPHEGIAHEHFLASGPFAILPMRGNRSSIVWTEKLHLADAIVNQSDQGFLAELESRFGDILGKISLDSPRFHYPLSLQFAERAVDRRLVLIGDAAHGMHPIAGQGMNMGIRDVAALAEILADAHRLGTTDLGQPALLARYERWRRFDNMLMLAMTDVLNRLFSNSHPVLAFGRRLGLGLVQRMGRTKKIFMRHAMGVVGDLPRLMRGQPL